jgi:hypothetical protein
MLLRPFIGTRQRCLAKLESSAIRMKSSVEAFIVVVYAGLGMSLPCLCPVMAGPTENGALQERTTPQPQASQQEPMAPAVFVFPGGTPFTFVTAVQAFCRVDWTDIVTIPNDMTQAQVPKLRVPTSKPEDLLKLYNRLGERNPALGNWHWEGPVEHPYFLALVPAQAGVVAALTEEPVALRVFQLRYISGTNLNQLADAISTATDLPTESARKISQSARVGRLVIDQRTGSVIASGPATYLKRVEAVIRALDIAAADPAQVIKRAGRSSGEKN